MPAIDDDLFASVEAYLDRLFVPADPVLESSLKAALDAGLPEIQVNPGLGKLLYLLAKLVDARRVLELGTLGGYSTIWLARALPADGRLVTIDCEPKHAEVARENLRRAGVDDRVEVVVGQAAEVLAGMEAGSPEPFDLVFLDADKAGYPAYLELVVPLTRPGGLVLADNVVRAGAVLEPDPSDASDRGAAEFNAKLSADPRLEAVVLQLVGAKGHDGLAIARVRDHHTA